MAAHVAHHDSEHVKEPDLAAVYSDDFEAPALKPPDLYVFRGFIPESYNQHTDGIDTLSVPARLLATGGVVRSVEARLMGRQTCINLRLAKEGEEPGALNGLIQALRLAEGQTPQEFIDSHPSGTVVFARRPLSCFESISWLALPPTTHVFVQTMHSDRFQPASIEHPLLQTYVDQQLARCRNIDDEGDFAREFVGTTRGWPQFWLNDRETARRPWVNIERSNKKESGSRQLKFNDTILHEHPPSPFNTFARRYLPANFAALTYRCSKGHTLPPSNTIARVEDWTNCKMRDANTTHFMFGFGSLMNTKSRTSSDPAAIAAIPVRVSAKVGYVRRWNFQHGMAQLTALGVEAVLDGQTGCTINGVVTPIKGAGNGSSATLPQAVLEREVGYSPVPIDASMCEFLSWAKLPQGSTIWLFVPNGPSDSPPGHGLCPASFHHPILQSYVDICILGCLEQSREFAIEFIKSTRGWDGPWLNDRKVPRRPWVHQPKYKVVDNLLMEVIPNEFSQRMLPSEFGAHALEVSIQTSLRGSGPEETGGTRNQKSRMSNLTADSLLEKVLAYDE